MDPEHVSWVDQSTNFAIDGTSVPVDDEDGFAGRRN